MLHVWERERVKDTRGKTWERVTGESRVETLRVHRVNQCSFTLIFLFTVSLDQISARISTLARAKVSLTESDMLEIPMSNVIFFKFGKQCHLLTII